MVTVRMPLLPVNRMLAFCTNAVLDELDAKGHPGCSVSCDKKNIPLQKYLVKLGFDEIDTVALIGKHVVLYEKDFS